MDTKIYRNIHLRVISILMCLLLAVIPFFHPEKVNANPAIVFAGIISILATGMIAGKYVSDTILTQEQINNANDYCTANLQTAFPDPAEYNKQLTTLQNLDNDIRAGKDIDWSKYSGKALYAVLKGVVDVVWPFTESDFNKLDGYTLLGSYGSYLYYVKLQEEYTSYGITYHKLPYFPVTGWDFTDYRAIYHKYANYDKPISEKYASFDVQIYNEQKYFTNVKGFSKIMGCDFTLQNQGSGSLTDSTGLLAKFLGHNPSATCIYKPELKQTLPNKVKLPTRLPQTVINNINNYIDNSTENLIIAPTADELPTLPDNYNPNTDDLPDLPGYVDVTPDQEPTTDPEPTPTPTPTPPDPTPTPPEYNGDEWVNPIGNFFDGLLKFMKAAFVPTQSLDFSPLQNMESGTFGAKFPFSLPSDFGKILGVLQADPITPKFDASIPLSKVGYQDIPMEIDLEPYSNIAGICKSGFVILFCIGLFFLTRRFMSPGG